MSKDEKQSGTLNSKPPLDILSRPEFIAAVRYGDGRSELFRIKNADDINEARELVYEYVDNVQSVVISHRDSTD